MSSVCPGEMSLLCLVLTQRGSSLPPGWDTLWWLREEDRVGSGLMGKRRRRRSQQECDTPCVHFAHSRESWPPLSPLQVLEATRGPRPPVLEVQRVNQEWCYTLVSEPPLTLRVQGNGQGWPYCALQWVLIPKARVGFPEPSVGLPRRCEVM